jgi:hypothetical protein
MLLVMQLSPPLYNILPLRFNYSCIYKLSICSLQLL